MKSQLNDIKSYTDFFAKDQDCGTFIPVNSVEIADILVVTITTTNSGSYARPNKTACVLFIVRQRHIIMTEYTAVV